MKRRLAEEQGLKVFSFITISIGCIGRGNLSYAADMLDSAARMLREAAGLSNPPTMVYPPGHAVQHTERKEQHFGDRGARR